MFYESLKRPTAGATFEHLDCRSKNIASTSLKAVYKLDTTNMQWIFKDISFLDLFQRVHFSRLNTSFQEDSLFYFLKSNNYS